MWNDGEPAIVSTGKEAERMVGELRELAFRKGTKNEVSPPAKSGLLLGFVPRSTQGCVVVFRAMMSSGLSLRDRDKCYADVDAACSYLMACERGLPSECQKGAWIYAGLT